jgi:transcriptional regulator with XRE-family HTH domain
MEEFDLSTFSGRFRSARIEAGKSVEELAAETNVPAESIRAWESGAYDEDIRKLAEETRAAGVEEAEDLALFSEFLDTHPPLGPGE